MTKEELIEFLSKTPENFNPNVVRDLIENGGGGQVVHEVNLTTKQSAEFECTVFDLNNQGFAAFLEAAGNDLPMFDIEYSIELTASQAVKSFTSVPIWRGIDPDSNFNCIQLATGPHDCSIDVGSIVSAPEGIVFLEGSDGLVFYADDWRQRTSSTKWNTQINIDVNADFVSAKLRYYTNADGTPVIRSQASNS